MEGIIAQLSRLKTSKLWHMSFIGMELLLHMIKLLLSLYKYLTIGDVA